jgi:thioredoxin 1
MEVNDMAIELNRDNYQTEVNGADKPVLVDFWGPRCGPCLSLMPSVEKLEKEYEGRIKVAKLNATENRMLCATLRVMGLPTFIVYKGGLEVRRLTGEKVTIGEIKEAVEAVLN